MAGKIKVAFIKHLGLITAGTEKFLQTIATGLPKYEFEIHYYANKLIEIEHDDELYHTLNKLAQKKFNKMYDYETQMKNIINTYIDTIKIPYLSKLKRLYLNIKQQFPLRQHRRWK